MSIQGNGTWVVGDNWPWPQVIFSDYYTIGLAIYSGKVYLFELTCSSSNVWTASARQELGTASVIDFVDFAFAGPFYIVSVVGFTTSPNAVSIDSYIRNPGSITPIVSTLPTAKIPEFMCCTNFKQQIIIGGVNTTNTTDFGDMNLGTVAWSGIGSLDYRVDTDPTAGYTQVTWDKGGYGLVHRVERLNDFVVVYGDGGRMALRPISEPVSGYGRVELPGLGIRSGNHMAGDYQTHFFIDADDDLWMVSGQLEFQNLGYSEFLSVLTADTDNSPVRMSYDGRRQRLSICTADQGFMLTKDGMYEMHQQATSIGDYNGIPCGFFLDNEDYEWRIKTAGLDLTQRGMKTIGFAEVGMDYVNSTYPNAYVGVDYKYDYRGDYTTGSFVRLNKEGVGYIGVTAPDVRLKLKGTSYQSASIVLDYIKLRTKLSDKRYVRGLYNANTTSTRAGE